MATAVQLRLNEILQFDENNEPIPLVENLTSIAEKKL